MNSAFPASWSSVYHKKISLDELHEACSTNTFMAVEQNVPLFTQLLCSWNALRPLKGHLAFFVQARNAGTKKWGAWHRMFEWGKGIQRSYSTKPDGFTRYIHVRLETELHSYADAFRVKVIAEGGAAIDSLRSIAVTVTNMREFKSEQNIARLVRLAPVYLAEIPKISQMALKHSDSRRICSPVSCTMMTRYLTGNLINPLVFAKQVYDEGLQAYGSWPFNVAHAYECCKGKNWFYVTRLNSFVELHRQLKRGFPVVVSVRGFLRGAPQPFPQGHFLVVTGWDNSTGEVLCHDPSVDRHYQVLKRYKIADFLASWEKSRRLAYWTEPA